MNSYRYQSNTMNDSHKERRNSKWNVEMHGFLIQKQKKKNWSRLQINEDYKKCLDAGKTERECVTQIIREARAAGYESLEEKTAKGEKLKAGDKVYTVGMKKIIALFHIGQDDISEGMNILGAHIDSPRLDVKQNPLYEDTDLAYLDTHYYGGVKKYQWVTLPLAIHGVVVKKDGSTAEVNIGEDEDDPIVYIWKMIRRKRQ